VRAAGLTDVGRTRERNEDSVFVGDAVFAVADGMGGHRGGDIASALALEPISALDDIDARKAAGHIAETVRRSNKHVFSSAQKDPELKGMGTTMTAVAVHDGVAHLAHVGDSRCYLIRGGTITQLSRDHTLVARLVADGKLTPAQAETHPQRSVLTRALGAERDVDVQAQNVVLASGDRLVLCSDGLSGLLSDQEIMARAATGSDLEEICRDLINEANERGGPDNISVIIVDVEESPRDGTAARAEPLAIVRDRRAPVRALVWTGLIVAVVLATFIGLRIWASGSYYVGTDGELVTIYKGLPLDLGPLTLSSEEEPTNVLMEDIQSDAIVRSLEEGIRADSLAEARRIVEEQIRPNLRPGPPSGTAPKLSSPSPS
jgi:protein phosphatase